MFKSSKDAWNITQYCSSDKQAIGTFAHMWSNGAVDGTENWETAEAEGQPVKDLSLSEDKFPCKLCLSCQAVTDICNLLSDHLETNASCVCCCESHCCAAFLGSVQHPLSSTGGMSQTLSSVIHAPATCKRVKQEFLAFSVGSCPYPTSFGNVMTHSSATSAEIRLSTRLSSQYCPPI